MIAHASKDENNRYANGAEGDQTGKEVCIREWYNRPWNVILRYPNKDVARDVAFLMWNLTTNDLVGYNQNQRLTMYDRLKNTPDWNPAHIKEACECDCSSAVAAILIAAGNRNKIRKLRDLSPALTTKNMKKALVAAGFTALVDVVYTSSDKFLLPGDILLCQNHHVAINLDKGEGDSAYKEIALEIKSGLHGNGNARKQNLAELGIDYTTAQAEVNLLCF